MVYMFLLISCFLINPQNKSLKKKIKGAYVKGELLVKFKDSVNTLAITKFSENINAKKVFHKNKYQDFIKINFDEKEQSIEEIIEQHKDNNDIEYIEPNYIVSINSNPAYYNNQWAFKNLGSTLSTITSSNPVNSPSDLIYSTGTIGKDINIENLWDEKGSDCSSVKIAIIDTGINPYQDEFQNIDLKLYNAIKDIEDEAYDLNGHGTHVAGIIASRGDKIKGVCSNASLIIIKALDDTGDGSIENIIKGISYAIENNAKVVNLSLGMSSPNLPSSLRTAIRNASNNDLMFIVAAGNENVNADGDIEDGITYYSYPCAINEPNLICIGSLNSHFQVPTFSNYGIFSVHLAAPGANILSSYIKEYSSYSDNWALFPGSWTKKTYKNKYAYQIPSNFNMESQYPESIINSSFGGKEIKYSLGNTYELVATSFYTTYLLEDFNKINFSIGSWSLPGGFINNKIDKYYSYSYSNENCINPCEIKFISSYGSDSIGGFAVFDLTVTALDANKANDLYKYLHGTSMSTPFVTGVYALLKSLFPNRSSYDLLSAIVYSRTNHRANKNLATNFALDAYKSYELLESESLLAPTYIKATLSSR